MLDLEFAQLTDPGRVREQNEDALGYVLPATTTRVQSQGWIFVLADGVGGHDHGEVASQLAVETVLTGFRKIPPGVMHVSLLPKLVQEANAAVFERGHDRQGKQQMGTTLVVCALRFDSAVISHVGDSRCYLFRNGAGAALTRDHTMAAEQLRMNLLSEEEAETSDRKHVLTRCLGVDMFVAPDTITVNIIPGDVLMLCSDGLHGLVSMPMMERILATHTDLNAAAKALVAAANEEGGHDNVSVQLIRILSVERMGLYRGRPYRML
jgi:serine/threonine protein phosphatase PrpC